MNHSSPTPSPHDGHTPFGLRLFGFYLIVYIVFMGLNAFRADLMALKIIGGLNLAILYGFGLIALAILLSLVYLRYASKWSKKDSQ